MFSYYRREDSHESLDSTENRSKVISMDEEEADTDLETDRLLGQQRLDDQGFYDEKNWSSGDRKLKIKSPSTSKSPQIINNFPSSGIRQITDMNGLNGDQSLSCIDKSPTDSTKSKKDEKKGGKTRNKEGTFDSIYSLMFISYFSLFFLKFKQNQLSFLFLHFSSSKLSKIIIGR